MFKQLEEDINTIYNDKNVNLNEMKKSGQGMYMEFNKERITVEKSNGS